MTIRKLLLGTIAASLLAVCPAAALSDQDGRGNLIKKWQTLNVECRGGPGDADATTKACEQREVVFKELAARGCHFHHQSGLWTCK
jgi:hypothetical protein